MATKHAQLHEALEALRSQNPGREDQFVLWLLPNDGGWIEYSPPGEYVYTVYSTAIGCDGVVFCGDHGHYPQGRKDSAKPKSAYLPACKCRKAVLCSA